MLWRHLQMLRRHILHIDINIDIELHTHIYIHSHYGLKVAVELKSNIFWLPFLELGTKHPWKELQRQSLELRPKDGPSRDCCTRDSSHNQPPNADTIAYASKILLKGSWYSCLIWGYASASQIQKWMLTSVIYRMEHRAPNGGPRESTQGAEEFCNPIGGTTIWTNQYPQSSCL